MTKQFLKVIQLMQGGAVSWTYNPWLLTLYFSVLSVQEVRGRIILRECHPWEAEEREMGKEARKRKCNYRSVLLIHHLLVSRATDCCLTSWGHFLGKLIQKQHFRRVHWLEEGRKMNLPVAVSNGTLISRLYICGYTMRSSGVGDGGQDTLFVGLCPLKSLMRELR